MPDSPFRTQVSACADDTKRLKRIINLIPNIMNKLLFWAMFTLLLLCTITTLLCFAWSCFAWSAQVRAGPFAGFVDVRICLLHFA